MNDWTEQALCGKAPQPFFPDSEVEAAYESAIAYCRRCPVSAICLSKAMREEAGKRATNRHGARGGLTPMQRGALEFDLQHGTNSCYVNDLCRCQPCSAAATAARRPKTTFAA